MSERTFGPSSLYDSSMKVCCSEDDHRFTASPKDISTVFVRPRARDSADVLGRVSESLRTYPLTFYVRNWIFSRVRGVAMQRGVSCVY